MAEPNGPGRPPGKDDARTKAALDAFQKAMAKGWTWRSSVREALRAADEFRPPPAPAAEPPA